MPDDLPKGVPVTLRFKYSGVLNTPSGGPLLNKRLAYVGDDQGYLMYASRWFPFHDYAADLATSDITINVPGGMQVVGFSDSPAAGGGKVRFTQSKPGLVGNFAYGKFTNKTMRFGEYELQFYTRRGNDQQVAAFGETIGKALEFYTQKYGASDMGKRLIVAQIDDESLDLYSSLGMLFISSKEFEQPRGITQERLQREAAFQWWGQTVGLKSFDDAWLSQGLAEYSAYALRESSMTGAQLESLRRELLETACACEPRRPVDRLPVHHVRQGRVRLQAAPRHARADKIRPVAAHVPAGIPRQERLDR
jgi:hypothetical protein